jgi:hypothetical protein
MVLKFSSSSKIYSDNEINLEVQKFGFQYSLLNKTFPIKYEPKWFDELKKAADYIKTEYAGKNIKITENKSYPISSLDREILEGELNIKIIESKE